MGVHIFTKIKDTDHWKQKKIFLQLIHFRKSLFFIYAFFQKMLNVSSERSFRDLRLWDKKEMTRFYQI